MSKCIPSAVFFGASASTFFSPSFCPADMLNFSIFRPFKIGILVRQNPQLVQAGGRFLRIQLRPNFPPFQHRDLKRLQRKPHCLASDIIMIV